MLVGAETGLDGLEVFLGLLVIFDGFGVLFLHSLEGGLLLLGLGLFVSHGLLIARDVLPKIRLPFLLRLQAILLCWIGLD